MLCKHDWKMINETITKSKLEVAMGTLKPTMKKVNIPWQVVDVERKLIQVFSCHKCGKLKRFVEKI